MITQKELEARAIKAVYSEKFQELFEREVIPWLSGKDIDIDEDVEDYEELLQHMRNWGGKFFRGTAKQQSALLFEAKRHGIPYHPPPPRRRYIWKTVERIVYVSRKTGEEIPKPRRYNLIINATMHRVKIYGKIRTQYRHKSGKNKGKYIKKSEVKRRVMYKDRASGKIISKPKREKRGFSYLEEIEE